MWFLRPGVWTERVNFQYTPCLVLDVLGRYGEHVTADINADILVPSEPMLRVDEPA
jgi:hypothetical protein